MSRVQSLTHAAAMSAAGNIPEIAFEAQNRKASGRSIRQFSLGDFPLLPQRGLV